MWRSNKPMQIFLRGVAYHFDEIVPIERIPALAENAALLASFHEAGYRTYAHSDHTLAEQAVASVRKTLAAAQLTARDIDAVVLGTSEMRETKRYPEFLSTELLMALEMTDVPLVGVTLAGCANYASCVRVARNMLVAEGMKNVLVVETDQVRGTMERPLKNSDGTASAIFADGAASVVVSAQAPPAGADFEMVAMAQTIKPIDTEKAEVNDIALNNLFGFRQVVDAVLAQAKVGRGDFAGVFLPNIKPSIVEEIAEVLGLPAPYLQNCSRTAHVWSCDNLINLVDHCAGAARVPAGALFLLVCQAESYFSAIACRKR